MSNPRHFGGLPRGPGPDGRSINEVRKHLGELLPVLRRSLLKGTYRPGMIRRVWIPKPGGGERGLGIPDVVDRWVQQAVHRVLSPHWEPTIEPWLSTGTQLSHGYRRGQDVFRRRVRMGSRSRS